MLAECARSQLQQWKEKGQSRNKGQQCKGLHIYMCASALGRQSTAPPHGPASAPNGQNGMQGYSRHIIGNLVGRVDQFIPASRPNAKTWLRTSLGYRRRLVGL